MNTATSDGILVDRNPEGTHGGRNGDGNSTTSGKCSSWCSSVSGIMGLSTLEVENKDYSN